jgi:hypothetical protein
MNDPIAQRSVYLKSEDGDVEIPVRIFAPEKSDRSWKCRYTIGWPEGEFENAIFGEDSMQALILTTQIIGVHLYTSDHHKSGKLYSGEPGGGYGFPVPNGSRDLLEGDDKKFF